MTFYIFLHNMQLIRDIFDYIWTTWFWTPGTRNALGPNLDWINKWILNFKHNFLLYFATILVRPLGDFSRIQHVICNTDLEETQLGLYEVIKVKQAQYACVRQYMPFFLGYCTRQFNQCAVKAKSLCTLEKCLLLDISLFLNLTKNLSHPDLLCGFLPQHCFDYQTENMVETVSKMQRLQ